MPYSYGRRFFDHDFEIITYLVKKQPSRRRLTAEAAGEFNRERLVWIPFPGGIHFLLFSRGGLYFRAPGEKDKFLKKKKAAIFFPRGVFNLNTIKQLL